MTTLQPMVLEALTIWSVIAGSSAWIDWIEIIHAATPLLHSSTHIGLDQAALIPIQNNPALDQLIADLKAAVALPGWVGDVMKWAGLISLLLGIIAYSSSRPGPNRRRGYQLAIAGFVLAVVGIAFSTFIGLLNYVFSG